jgi:hypothetical protein
MDNAMTTNCPHCGFEFQYLRSQHVEKCSKIPPVEELVKIIDNDDLLSLSGLEARYGLKPKYIIYRLRNTKWTKKKFLERGIEITKRGSAPRLSDRSESITFQSEEKIEERRQLFKDGKLKKCRCEILIELDEDFCEYCVSEGFT